MYGLYDPMSGSWYGCTHQVIDVRVDGAEWSKVYWNWAGDTSTSYTDRARTQLGNALDTQFDRDKAAWDAAHQPPPPPYWGY
jgi:hypothetical protein